MSAEKELRRLDDIVEGCLSEDPRFEGKSLLEVMETPEGQEEVDKLLMELKRRGTKFLIADREPEQPSDAEFN